MMNFYRKYRDHLKLFLVGFGFLLFYFVESALLSQLFGIFTDSTVLPMYVSDILIVVVCVFFYRKVICHMPNPFRRKQESFKGFSGAGKLFLTILFLTMFFTSQFCSGVFSYWFPVSYDAAYDALTGVDIALYGGLSVVLAPLAEEFLFRGVLYQYLRQRFSVFSAVFVSALLFTLIHGTAGHIPVTMGLTVFVCFIMEWTGQIRYAVLAHCLYNLLALSFMMAVPVSNFTAVGLFALQFLVMVILFIMRNRFVFRFEKGAPTLENWTEKQLRNWTNNHRTGSDGSKSRHIDEK